MSLSLGARYARHPRLAPPPHQRHHERGRGVRVGDFEAVLEWAIGVRAASSYEVTTLDDPPRVVVDITAD